MNFNSDLDLIPGADSLLKIIEGPDNSKQIRLQMEDLITGESNNEKHILLKLSRFILVSICYSELVYNCSEYPVI